MKNNNTLYGDWRLKLKDAFSRSAAYGLFIDFQDFYYSTATHSAFVKGGELSRNLQEKGIESLWAACPLNVRSPSELAVPFKEAVLSGRERFKFAAPAPDDMVYLKYAKSICTNGRASERLYDMQRPVFMAGGVFATKCFGASVVDIMHMIDCDVIVALDATNFNDLEETRILDHMYNFSALHDADRLGRYHIASTQEIIDALPKPN